MPTNERAWATIFAGLTGLWLILDAKAAAATSALFCFMACVEGLSKAIKTRAKPE